MANKEILGLEIEVDSGEIDETEKKLSKLDKLLEQTQKRAAILGKTKIGPKISLDDRFSSAAEKVTRTLSQIQRTKVSPIVRLGDQVSTAAAKIQASLIAMSMRRWRVSVAGVDWDEVVGGSFSEWMGSEGKATMKQISSTISTALGSGLKDAMMGALGLAEPSKEMLPRRRVDFAEEDRNLLQEKNGSPYAEAGRKAGEQFFQAFLGTFDPNQVTDTLNKIQSKNKTEDDKASKWSEKASEFGEQLVMAVIVELLMKFGEKLISKGRLKGNLTPALPTTVTTTPKVTPGGAGLEVPESLPPRSFTHRNWLTRLIYNVENIGKIALPIAFSAGVVISSYKIQKFYEEKGLQDVAETIPKRFWAFLTEPSVSEKNEKPAENMNFFEKLKDQGNYLVNDYFNDLWKSMKANWEVLGGDGKYSISDDGLVQIVNSQNGSILYSDLSNNRFSEQSNDKNLMQYNSMNPNNLSGSNVNENLPNLNILKIMESFQNPGQSTTINVTIPSGAVNLSVNNKDELNYEEIGNVTARMINNEIRLAMQNME
ncbi:hypothetical protein V3851_03655 [Paenibacillus sp. M1]|uniref:Uncharacterized protein n=1 Tax=Paenibacillus haidiansis TaxID=1574488 RepID=A0ABU7VMB8_9BACL